MNATKPKHKLTAKAIPIIFLLLASIYITLDTLNTTNNTTTHNERHLTSSTSHTFHLPTNPPDDDTIIPPSLRLPPDQIRYAAFGTSHTWGAGYGTGSLAERKTYVYPWLLSPNATNFAIRAGGPNYPAVCTSTMMGGEEAVYDVVVFEFFMRAQDGLATLARRVRERFPDALLIFLLNWNPKMIRRCLDGEECTETQSVFDYVEERGLDLHNGGIHDEMVHALFRGGEGEGEEDNETFRFGQFADVDKLKVVFDVAKDVGGYVAPMPSPENPRDWLNYAHMFATDVHHFSPDGHREIHDRVQSIVDWHGVPLHPRIQPFQEFDYCMNWFESGDTTGISYSSNGVVEKMPRTAKYTLSFGDVDGEKGDGWIKKKGDGWIRVENPTNQVLVLYLGYMTTGPKPSLYPATQVFIESIDSDGSVHSSGYDKENPIVLDPNTSIEWPGAVHISRIENVGVLHPGYSFVRFSQLEETERPFRLVSLMITTEELGEQMDNHLPGGTEN